VRVFHRNRVGMARFRLRAFDGLGHATLR
jgi:hypothetical protein